MYIVQYIKKSCNNLKRPWIVTVFLLELQQFQCKRCKNNYSCTHLWELTVHKTQARRNKLRKIWGIQSGAFVRVNYRVISRTVEANATEVQPHHRVINYGQLTTVGVGILFLHAMDAKRCKKKSLLISHT